MRFKLNSKVVYEGPFSCRDSLSWWCDGFTLQLMLNRTNLFAGAGMPQGDRLSWSVLDGESKGNAVFIPYRDGEGAWAAKYVAEDSRRCACRHPLLCRKGRGLTEMDFYIVQESAT